MDFSTSSHIYGYDNISSKFDFQGPGLEVKVAVTEIFSNPSQPQNLNVYNTITFTLRSQAFCFFFYITTVCNEIPQFSVCRQVVLCNGICITCNALFLIETLISKQISVLKFSFQTFIFYKFKINFNFWMGFSKNLSFKIVMSWRAIWRWASSRVNLLVNLYSKLYVTFILQWIAFMFLGMKH